ncbi:pyridine nucleotide-disulfide oxidoreductase/dicluster-binding protein [Anoxynatronum sibiricum]|uniref:Pyridine nucleotide-disulfide oxidoreductase/dicluster-binding protein n=1 Tax=Anoxynatronum sibiricum TaxID=210623 RepID=A0ABU9VR81_9CLOT
MKRTEIRAYEDRCTQSDPPACESRCPVHVDVKQMMLHMQKGELEEALRVYQKKIPFPRIISSVCDQPCQDVCMRKEMGGSLQIREIEKTCTTLGIIATKKIRIFKKTDHRVAVIGAGLSGLTAALLLYEKGHVVHVYEKKAEIGGQIRGFSSERLPKQLIDEDFDFLKSTGIQFFMGCEIGRDKPFDTIIDAYDAVFLGMGTMQAGMVATGKTQSLEIDLQTLSTEVSGVFAGGSMTRNQADYSPITSIAEGRSAAISIDRFVKKVSLTEGRHHEGAYKTRLYTNIQSVEHWAPVPPVDEGGGYSADEAAAEAARCIQCECMECVKSCKFLQSYGSYPKKYVREIANNVNIMMGIRQTKHMVNSCTYCGLCEERCPNALNMGEVCATAKEELVAKNAMPEAIHDFPIRDMQFSNSDYFQLFRHQPGMKSSQYMFYPGCQIAALAPEHVMKAYEYLTTHLAGGVGLNLGCCGAPAAWAGRDPLFKNTLEIFTKTWEEAGKPLIITACSTCHKIFKEALSDHVVQSIWEIYCQRGLPFQGTPAGHHRKISIHDACTAKNEPRVHQAVRHILISKGFEIQELPFSGEKSKCCGYGGLVSFANRQLAQEMVADRIGESQQDYIVYCQMCHDYFSKQGKTCWHIFDLIHRDLSQEDWRGESNQLTFSQRHENRIKLKQRLLKEVWRDDMDRQPEDHESIVVRFSPKMEQVMNDRLILLSDIQQVIYHAETTNNKIYHPNNNHYTAKLRPGIITYWVEYSIEETSFLVHKAYSHRLEINRQVKENEHRKYSL